MTWKPISETELACQIRDAASELKGADAKKFAFIQTTPHRIPCKRNAQMPNEEIFVVAQAGNRVLVFDDVEDEFGVSDLAESPVLEKWELLGSLSNALTKF